MYLWGLANKSLSIHLAKSKLELDWMTLVFMYLISTISCHITALFQLYLCKYKQVKALLQLEELATPHCTDDGAETRWGDAGCQAVPLAQSLSSNTKPRYFRAMWNTILPTTPTPKTTQGRGWSPACVCAQYSEWAQPLDVRGVFCTLPKRQTFPSF